VERIAELQDLAAKTLREMGCSNVSLLTGDGTLGWPEEGPFDAILVTAGAPAAPESLKAQLSESGGRLVVPVGDRYVQELVRFTREGSEFRFEKLLDCRFVPLLGEEGW
jgi:protein-L-isoaspartate(D-aspartate) O-methyltransferase